MKYLILLLMCAGITLTSCEKCGHCKMPGSTSSTTYCGKPDYDNAKEACEQAASLGYVWEDE